MQALKNDPDALKGHMSSFSLWFDYCCSQLQSQPFTVCSPLHSSDKSLWHICFSFLDISDFLNPPIQMEKHVCQYVQGYGWNDAVWETNKSHR